MSHEDHINSVTVNFNAMDPFRYDMFNPKINFVSDLQSDEESMDESDNHSDDSTFADAMSTIEEGGKYECFEQHGRNVYPLRRKEQ